MALQTGARTLQTATMNGHARRSTKKIGNSDPPFLRGLQIWQTNQASMAHQRSAGTHMNNHSTQPSGIS